MQWCGPSVTAVQPENTSVPSEHSLLLQSLPSSVPFIAESYSIVRVHHSLFIHRKTFALFLPIRNNATMNICVKPSMWTYVLVFLGKRPRSKIAGLYGSNFLSIGHIFQAAAPFFPPAVYNHSSFSTPSPTRVTVHRFDNGHPSEVTSHCGFHLHFCGRVPSQFVHHFG